MKKVLGKEDESQVTVKPTDITSAKRSYRTRNEGNFPHNFEIHLVKETDKKYGENPNQHAATYQVEEMKHNTVTLAKLTNLQSVRSDGKGKGGLSLTNEMDITRAMDNLKFFKYKTAVIMKHNIVSGFATTYTFADNALENMADLFREARDCDIRSNFGGTLVVNRTLDMETAKAMFELSGQSPFFVDVVAAPGYEEGVLTYIESKKKDIRIGEFSNLNAIPKFQGDETYGLFSIKDLGVGRWGVQDMYLTSIRSADDLKLRPMIIKTDKEKNDTTEHTINCVPTKAQTDDLLTAWYLNISGARSNGVVAVKDGKLVSMGSGQVERVGAIEQMIVKGVQKYLSRKGVEYDPLMGTNGKEHHDEHNPFIGAAVSSDAFFPFDDSIKTLARVKVGAVIQPYGSIRDADVIDAANKYKIAMPATLERCFGHF